MSLKHHAEVIPALAALETLGEPIEKVVAEKHIGITRAEMERAKNDGRHEVIEELRQKVATHLPHVIGLIH
ncbi:hypothetical protein [Tumebacillus permanentifrigoris]|uniref:Uncharacterized protein n=1 Tax=Tumebacillus permanentifrigoris TaxID=378543 RepID=A0A316D4U0_9BACL|nr:hypothetical protein [Tumebacillus permanentifrigoris]PWK05328.1 hypothetical protein C7459_12480 [Tumebacillus permanentifrigoris]